MEGENPFANRNEELYKKFNNRKTDAMLNAVATQLDNLSMVVNEIRNEQKRIAQDLLNNTMHTESVAQRQKEYTIPMLDGIRKHFFGGNGNGGLLEEHIKCQERMLRLEKASESARQLRISVIFLMITVIVSTVSFISSSIYTWAKMNYQQEIDHERIAKLEEFTEKYHPRINNNEVHKK